MPSEKEPAPDPIDVVVGPDGELLPYVDLEEHIAELERNAAIPPPA